MKNVKFILVILSSFFISVQGYGAEHNLPTEESTKTKPLTKRSPVAPLQGIARLSDNAKKTILEMCGLFTERNLRQTCKDWHDRRSEQPSYERYGDVFSGSTLLSTGIRVFFGMEPLDAMAKKNWKAYATHALFIECLYQFLETCQEEISLKTATRAYKAPNVLYTVEDLTGFTAEEDLQNYLQRFKEFATNKRALNIATHIQPGASRCAESIRWCDYVVYASKIKVSGRYPFPENFASLPPLRALQEHSKDLLMTVGSRNFSPSTFSQWGIFRNPVSCFYDGNNFPGISLKLHGFSACVWKSIYPEKEHMVVNAAYAMAKVLVNSSWQKGDFFLLQVGKDWADCTSKERQPKEDDGETGCQITSSALKRLFLG